MKTFEQRQLEALNPALSITEAANLLLEVEIKSGTPVALLDGTPYGLDGIRGIAKGRAQDKAGFVDVEMPNGMVVPIEANLLLPV